MTQDPEGALERLESAIEDWGRQLSSAHAALKQDLESARTDLPSAEPGAELANPREPLDATLRGVAQLGALLAEWSAAARESVRERAALDDVARLWRAAETRRESVDAALLEMLGRLLEALRAAAATGDERQAAGLCALNQRIEAGFNALQASGSTVETTVGGLAASLEQLTGLTAQLQTVQESLSAFSTRFDEFASDYGEFRQKFAEQTRHFESLTAGQESLRQSIATLDASFVAGRGALESAVNAGFQELQVAQHTAHHRIEALSAAVEQPIEAIQARLVAQGGVIDKVESAFDEQRRNAASQAERLVAVEAVLGAVREEVEGVHRVQQEHQGALVHQLEALEGQRDMLRGALAPAELARNVDELHEQVRGLRAELAAAREEQRDLGGRNAFAEIQAQLAALHEAVAGIGKPASAEATELAPLQEELAQTTAAMGRLESAVDALTRQDGTSERVGLQTEALAAAVERLTAAQAESRSAMAAQIARTEQAIESLRADYGQLAGRINALLASSQLGREHPPAELEQLRRGIAEIEGRLASVQAGQEALRDASGQLGQGGQAANRRLEELERVVSRLRERPATLSATDTAAAGPGGQDRAPAPANSAAAPIESPRDRRRLGDMLVRAGLITPQQLHEALEAQNEHPHRRLGNILVDNGFTTEQAVAEVLARQLGMPFERFSPGDADPAAARRISLRLAMHHLCVPLRFNGDRLVVALANPMDLIALEDTERAAGMPVEPVVATPADVAAAIHHVDSEPAHDATNGPGTAPV